jgi:hypothetical protein
VSSDQTGWTSGVQSPAGTRHFSLPRIARVLRADSPPTRGRRSIGSGGESSSMLRSVEGNAVQGRMLL